jgi:outer membrane protein assembly factor BamA
LERRLPQQRPGGAKQMLGLMMTLVLMMGVQDPSSGLTRTEALEQARQEKAAHLQKPTRTFLERGLLQFKERRVMERFYEGFHGFHPVLGGIKSGSGLGAGTYVETERIRASAQVSSRRYQKYELQFTAPLPTGLFADFRATYRDFPQERFFGIGQSSREQDQTSFRLEDTNYIGRFGFTPVSHVRAGVIAGWLETNIGAGTSERSPSIDYVFGVNDAPGMANQPDYLQAGAFLEMDYRDQPGNPRSGGLYKAAWTSFQDRKLGRYDFGQYDIEAQQYFPFFNQRRVIVLRARTTFTQTTSGQEVPFFMQPTLGGSEDLRGFREYRFRDRNMVVFNAEYRWEAFSGLDLAAFADAGQVAARPGDLRFADFQTSYGAGFRFNTEKNVFLRMDLGFSSEGRRLFVKFGHAF